MSITDKICESITYGMINSKDITVDERGQRDVERRKNQFNRIMKSFDPLKVNDLKVALIDGKFYCFDGQMTLKVLKAKNKGNDLEVPCRIYHGLTLLEISELFCSQGENKSPVSIGDILRVRAAYGDADAINFTRYTEKAGIDIAWNKGRARDAITAIRVAFNCFLRFKDPELYTKMLKVMKDAWSGLEGQMDHRLLSGMTEFFCAYQNRINIERLTKKLSKVRPMEIIRDAQIDRSSGARKYAVIILQRYNKGLREEAKLPNNL